MESKYANCLELILYVILFMAGYLISYTSRKICYSYETNVFYMYTTHCQLLHAQFIPKQKYQTLPIEVKGLVSNRFILKSVAPVTCKYLLLTAQSCILGNCMYMCIKSCPGFTKRKKRITVKLTSCTGVDCFPCRCCMLHVL